MKISWWMIFIGLACFSNGDQFDIELPNRFKRQSYWNQNYLNPPARPFSRPDYPLYPMQASTFPTPVGYVSYRQPYQVSNANPSPIYLSVNNQAAHRYPNAVVYNRPKEPQTGFPSIPSRWNYNMGNPQFPNNGYLQNQLKIMPYFSSYVGPEPTKPTPIGLYPEQLRPPPGTYDGYNVNRYYGQRYNALGQVPGLFERWQPQQRQGAVYLQRNT